MAVVNAIEDNTSLPSIAFTTAAMQFGMELMNYDVLWNVLPILSQ